MSAGNIKPGEVRDSIEHLCRFLAAYGIDLVPEVLRQAKFDGDAVR